MIISEKQIMRLLDIARAYICLTRDEENEEVVRKLLTEIINQQSDELKEIV